MATPSRSFFVRRANLYFSLVILLLLVLPNAAIQVVFWGGVFWSRPRLDLAVFMGLLLMALLAIVGPLALYGILQQLRGKICFSEEMVTVRSALHDRCLHASSPVTAR